MEVNRTFVLDWRSAFDRYQFDGPAIDPFRREVPKPSFNNCRTKARGQGGRPRQDYGPEVVQRVREMRGFGVNLKTIAKETGVSEPTIRKMLLRESPYVD